MLYQMANEGASCRKIADRLNDIGVPPSYSRDERKITVGKRKQSTADLWRLRRVRNMIISETYKGIHRYGKRSEKKREVMVGPFPRS